jgi:Fe-Mn family superoxide dismutase
MNRKLFLLRSLHGLAGAALAGPSLLHAAARQQDEPTGEAPLPSPGGPLTFLQEPLPYPFAALEPHIDALTMEVHYGRHHATYVKNVNEAIAAEGIAAPDEASFFSGISKLSAKARNNGGGAWNHNFFWKVMGPGKGGAPSGKAGDAINGAFGSFGKFKELFTDAAMKRFGSGWAWLVEHEGRLAIGSTPNQDNPLMDLSELKGRPLLAIDVWEHAYYLKYQNQRNAYVAAWWNLVDWDAMAKRLG